MPLAPEFDADRLILITLSMIAIGVVGLLIWDGVFPDRRDVRILGVLPDPDSPLRARPAGLARPGVRAVRHAALHAAVDRLRHDRHRLRRADLEDPRHHRPLRDGGAGVRLRVLRAGRRAVPAAARSSAAAPRRGRRSPFRCCSRSAWCSCCSSCPISARALRLGGASHEGLSRLSAIPPTWFFGFYEQLAGTAYGSTETLARLAVQADARGRARGRRALCLQLRAPVAARARRGRGAHLGVAVHAASPAPAACLGR